MRKIEIVEHVINNTTISRSQAIQAVDCAFDAIEKALCKGESVYIRGFGTIKTYITKERKAYLQENNGNHSGKTNSKTCSQ